MCNGKYYLYRHIRLDTNEPFYIGIGTKRLSTHIKYKSEYKRAYLKSDRNNIWKRIVDKTDYEVEILLESDDYNFIKQKEIEFIALYGRINNKTGILSNLTDGGEGVKGIIVSEETKKLRLLNNDFNKERKESFVKEREGQNIITEQGYSVKILEYNSSKDCTIRFENGIIFKHVNYYKIKKIKNPFYPSIANIGYFGIGIYKDYSAKSYIMWYTMISRLSEKGDMVCEEWCNYQNFAQWFEENYNSEYMQRWHLDKDILVKGNKIYSPDTCCFVPSELTNIFKTTSNKKENSSVGVRKEKSGTYTAVVRIDKISTYFKGYATDEEAFLVYKKLKEESFKIKANKFKGLITQECYESIYNHKVKKLYE